MPPLHHHLPVLLYRRQNTRDNGTKSKKALIVPPHIVLPPSAALTPLSSQIGVVAVGVFVFLFVVYLVIRSCRRSQPEPPRFFPEFLKRSWRKWRPGSSPEINPNSAGPTHVPSSRSLARRQRERDHAASTRIDRHTSVRSVMTLPEYRAIAAADRERTIAREGERGGIDVVIEFPETGEEEEGRREEHMQTLYEIRLARQIERAVVRESGDISAQQPARPGSSHSTVRLVPADSLSTAQQLMAALASFSDREPKLSKVQYAEIGVARHDGTRVRTSIDSERPPTENGLLLETGSLLESGAPMGTIERSGNRSYHARNESDLSVLETPERRSSDEIIRMGSAHGRRSHDEDYSLLPPPPFPESAPHPAPIEYDGSEWGPPPEYTSPTEAQGRGPEGPPVLRIDTGTPGASRAPSPQAPPRLHPRY